MFIGIDDTDSRSGMCTTYLCKEAIDALEASSIHCGIPRLIRLNPNIPYKTRGNGALSFEVDGDEDAVWDIVSKALDDFKMEGPGTNPGLVMCQNDAVPLLEDFYYLALRTHVSISSAHELAQKVCTRMKYYGNGRGVIGALASIGAVLDDSTYELIAYRQKDLRGTKRSVDEKSVKDIDRRYFPQIFDSYDWKNNYVAIAPNAPCPVLFGIRGDDASLLFDAAKKIESEPVYKMQMFLTNQATDAHIVSKRIAEMEEYDSVTCSCKISATPRFAHKGHLFLKIEDGGAEMLCAAYEPTKQFRKYISLLEKGDAVTVWGGVKRTCYGLTLNLEKIRIDSLVQRIEPTIPICCGSRMRSFGHMKGYRCKKCGARADYWDLEFHVSPRDISPGFHEVPVIARRHLSKPLARMRPANKNQ